MAAYMKTSRITIFQEVDEAEKGAEKVPNDEEEQVPQPSRKESSRTKGKQAKRKVVVTFFLVSTPPKPQTQKYSKSVSSMLLKTPEVVIDRNTSKTSQPTLEHCTKKNKQSKQIVDDHVADFFYENEISFNAINSRSWEIMLESIGQYGPGYRSPTYHEIREPLLKGCE
uniref:Uncharacterized protein n=1 Tax=Oryza brachyantha TaxID=4533 RepID=J3MVG8_ORYBR